MKYAYLLVFVLILSCKDKTETISDVKNTVTELKVDTYDSFGAKITHENANTASVLLKKYDSAKPADTLNTKAKVKVLDVCQAKGCWMIVDLGNDKTARVKFKDYAFFMPKDIKGKEVIINGKAFVNEMSVDELRHYAEDAGKTAAEVAEITEPETTYSFLADGVLLVN